MSEETEYSEEKSREAAGHIPFLTLTLQQLDLEYLEGALERMRDNLSTKESAVILAPNVNRQIELNKIEAAKLKYFEAILEARKALDKVGEAEAGFTESMDSWDKIEQAFGFG